MLAINILMSAFSYSIHLNILSLYINGNINTFRLSLVLEKYKWKIIKINGKGNAILRQKFLIKQKKYSIAYSLT